MSTQILRNSLLKEILRKAFNIGTYVGRSKTASVQLFSQLGRRDAAAPENSGAGPLKCPPDLLWELGAKGLHDLPREPSVDPAGLQPGNECGLPLGAAAHPGCHPLLGEAAIVEEAALLERIEAVTDDCFRELTGKQLARQQEPAVLASGEELNRLLARLVEQVCVAQLLHLPLLALPAGGEAEGLHELAGDKKRGAVGERDMNPPSGGSSVIDGLDQHA